MLSKSLYLLALFAVLGFASAGVVDWFGEPEEDEVEDQEDIDLMHHIQERAAEDKKDFGCKLQTIRDAATCCNVNLSFTEEQITKCTVKKNTQSGEGGKKKKEKKEKKDKDKKNKKEKEKKDENNTESSKAKREAPTAPKARACQLGCLVKAAGGMDAFVATLSSSNKGLDEDVKSANNMCNAADKSRVVADTKKCSNTNQAMMGCALQNLLVSLNKKKVCTNDPNGTCASSLTDLESCLPFDSTITLKAQSKSASAPSKRKNRQ